MVRQTARVSWLSHVSVPVLVALAIPVCAQAQTAAPATTVSEVVVVGATPLAGSGIDRDKAPEQVNVLNSAAITNGGTPDALRALNEQVGAINLDSAAGNPYQPTLFYHGFEASPLQGVSQGLAVYLNGVRFNQAFGDTVNWDLIPSVAIDRVTLQGSNPVFGLNALGGALSIQLKNGFTSPGGEIDVSGGSFGERQANAQYGAAFGNTALYVAASSLHEDGWRDLQSSDINSGYADFGWRGDAAEVHLSGRVANSTLNGPGTSPIELLAADSRAQFTAPNAIANRNAGVSLSGDFRLNPTTSVQAIAYYDDFHQAVVNGNSANDTPCNDGSGLLCDDDGDYSTTIGGATIPAFLGSSPFAYSELDDQTTETRSYGASAQVTNTNTLYGMNNHVVAGASYDGSRTDFSAISYIGGLTTVTRVFVGSGVVIDEPGNNVPVQVKIDNDAYGLFATDTLDIGSVSVTASGRYNSVQVDLHDQLGGDLTGNHSYDRFNPAIGAAWRATPWLTAYASYAEANRAPTPAELSCAGPNDSCSLANFFVGDPDLKQVISHTFEAGVRGRFDAMPGGSLSYSLGLYRTDLDNDIIFINSVTLGRAFFTNVGATRREGVDADLQFKTAHWSAYVAYAHTDATYQSGFVESGGSNPDADSNGNLTITPGDHFPGVPTDQVKLGVDVQPIDKLTLGLSAVGQTGSYLFGDEANVTPELPGFFVLNLSASYQATKHLELFARVENVTDAKYYTFGTFSPTSSVFLAQAPTATNPRSYSPAAPVGGFGGIRLTF